ncbi:hypothetical protein ASPWEDRAFT_387307 [Aspergillus wentii DTO 134E9]|uniref:Calcineurin-like phosphoesterase domain-containing protein n=1 Tax=Aspergillus wentii DTO 134E9 TaxID=1073089 RepID=A0A1L9RXV9_ASPWE|nr:uncharacterized protein ASPWEDRAFT_387307 [Aspergillus wentii DTO 134E9]OJJ39678.1 hypothetical protein ASPWEDRAFT_387307 [Aspergillus wentii DTO 134E9]
MAFRRSALDDLLHRPEQTSAWERFFSSPVKFLAGNLYRLLDNPCLRDYDSRGIRVVCVSDTHNTLPALPDGDVLVHAGDLTQSGSLEELNAQIEWLDKQPHRYKVVIAGNHDLCLDQHYRTKASTSTSGEMPVNWKSLIYLQNNLTTLDFGTRQVKVFGSPYTPKHGNWAFEYLRMGPDPWEGNIPAETDILVTHGPPRSHLDLGHLGCQYLLQSLWSMKNKPLLHVFGHIHGGYGRETLLWDSFQETYERMMNRQCSWMNLLKLVYYAVSRILSSRVCPKGIRTVLVNAATIGGLRDEKRREPISVVI